MPGLNGKIFITTCAKDKAAKIKSLLTPYEATVFNYSLVEIEPAVNNLQAIAQALPELAKYDWIIFTSTNGVNYFFYWINKLIPGEELDHLRFAVIGKATGEALEGKGLKADYLFEGRDSVEFALSLEQVFSGSRKKILFPQGNLASKNLENVLGEDHDVTPLVVYNTIKPVIDSKELQERINNNAYDMVIFLSPSAVENFAESIQLTEQLKAAAIGVTTKQALVSRGIEPKFMSPVPNLEIMINELEKYYQYPGSVASHDITQINN